MPDEALSERQATYLNNATVKGLYNLALYSIGDQPLAEQLVIDAFVSAYNRLLDKSDVTQFKIKSARQLYLKSKKTLISHSWHSPFELNAHESIEFADAKEKKRMHSLLAALNYDERFLLLLFLQQKFSLKQIAHILGIPKFIVKKQIFRMLNKAMNIWAKPTE